MFGKREIAVINACSEYFLTLRHAISMFSALVSTKGAAFI